jgi:hypothetical protein
LGRTVVVRRVVKAVGGAAQRISTVTTAAEAAVAKAFLGYMKHVDAMGVITEGSEAMTTDAANAALPALPASPDGRFRLRRNNDNIVITDTAGRTVRTLSAPDPTTYAAAAMSPDARRLALLLDPVGDDDGPVTTAVQIIDMATGVGAKPMTLAGNFGRVEWLDADRLVVSAGWNSEDRTSDDPDDQGPPPSARIIDASSGKDATTAPIAGRCYMRSIGNGRFVGAGAANCRPKAGRDTALAVFDPARGWHKIGGDSLDGLMIEALAPTPDGRRVAVAASADGVIGLFVFDLASGAAIDATELKGAKVIISLIYASDGRTVQFIADGSLYSWATESKADPRLVVARGVIPEMMVSDGKTLFMSGVADSAIARVDLATGEALPSLQHGAVIASGMLPGRPIFWAASATDGLRLFDTRDWSTVLTLYQFDAGGWLTVTPDGRYDTDLGPDANQFRWLVSDAPWQPLAPQTFMRDYFTPRLAERLLTCTAAGNCAGVFTPLAPISSLNRVLPKVNIAAIEPGGTPEEAIVRVEIREGVDANAANGRTRSGVYNVRLFRNGRFLAQNPIERNEALHPTLTEWRSRNGWDGGANADRVWQFPFAVRLPTAAGSEKSVFTAYAFNEDRVKSNTTRATYTRPVVAARKPRAFVISIGIDAYDEDRLALSYAASDAKLIGDRLAAIPAYEVRRATLTGVKLPDGSTRRVTRDTLRAVFAVLVGMGDVADVKAVLKGFDVGQLDQTAPDDVVILSFSGHGWANPQGDFFLVPSEGKWAGDAAQPDLSTLVSSADLTMWLRDIAAWDFAVIIDACHSGASVDSAGFKPGPMGDAGLGQLAYDKGMRILAATQASDLAMEDAALRQGLLTYALAGEGLDPAAPKADLNHDGQISLNEWLRYATQRLPQLSGNLHIGRIGTRASRGFNRISASAPPPKIQEPSLFDFTGTQASVVLRKVNP